MKYIRAIKTLILVLIASSLVSCNSYSKNDTTTHNKRALVFDAEKFEIQEVTVGNVSFKIRAYENIVYVEKPVDTVYQIMNIYIPAEYFKQKEKGGYNAETAPIFFENSVGGYMESTPKTAKGNDRPRMIGGGPSGIKTDDNSKYQDNAIPEMPQPKKRENIVARALSEGCVVACPGTRGRRTTTASGKYTGKAPAAIVDLKAAIRYLKFNDDKMPGNANKIVSDGTSAGGALSALLGSSGNVEDYELYLKELGAANATDDIFAVMAYCPITILEQADAAYEWQFSGVYTYSKRGDQGTLSETQIKISNDLEKQFPDYLNSLRLKTSDGNVLKLDEAGNGNFKEYIKSFIVSSAQTALNKGITLSEYNWISIKNNKVTDIDYDAYIVYLGRMKTPPSFDALDLSTRENQLFGNATTDKQHFTDYAVANSTAVAAKVDDKAVALMNPMTFIGKPYSDIPNYWRIRHGTKDPHTALAISAILATKLSNNGLDVDYAIPWDEPHGGYYDLDELFAWIKIVTK